MHDAISKRLLLQIKISVIGLNIEIKILINFKDIIIRINI